VSLELARARDEEGRDAAASNQWENPFVWLKEGWDKREKKSKIFQPFYGTNEKAWTVGVIPVENHVVGGW
jgi:hypothetical protein